MKLPITKVQTFQGTILKHLFVHLRAWIKNKKFSFLLIWEIVTWCGCSLNCVSVEWWLVHFFLCCLVIGSAADVRDLFRCWDTTYRRHRGIDSYSHRIHIIIIIFNPQNWLDDSCCLEITHRAYQQTFGGETFASVHPCKSSLGNITLLYTPA